MAPDRNRTPGILLERFVRIILGYHGAKPGAAAEFARKLLLGDAGVDEWRPSENEWDWLGHGIYFWEHSPERALRWATEKYGNQGQTPAVLGAVIQLGRCFDLLNEGVTLLLAQNYPVLAQDFANEGRSLPVN